MAPRAALAAALLLAAGLGDALSVDKDKMDRFLGHFDAKIQVIVSKSDKSIIKDGKDSSKPTGGAKKHLPKIHAASAVQAVSLQEQGYTALKETVSGEIEIITVETRSDLVKMPIPGVPGKFFKNLGVNQTWNGLFTKPHLFLEWLSAQRDPEKLVIFADGADVMFGGCTDKELLDAYHRTVAASGNVRVIMGAEMGLDPPPAGAYVDIHNQFEERRRAVQSAEGLQDSSYGSLASCEISRQNQAKCYVPKIASVKKGRWPCAGPCSNPPAMTFLNSGFIMGPVGELREVVSGMLRFEDLPADAPFRNNWHDQGAAILYMAENPHKVTLDYNGAIVLNLHQFPISEVMWVKQNSIRNKVLGRASCFIHANGPALGKLNRTLTHMSQMKTS